MGNETAEKKNTNALETGSQPGALTSDGNKGGTGDNATLGLGPSNPSTDQKLGGDAKDPEAEAKAKAEEDKAKFKEKSYSKQNVLPSTGRGAFDAVYDPKAGTLNITVKVDFKAEDQGSETWGGTGLAGALERAINETAWLLKYQQLVKQRWSDKYTMFCTKKYWDDLVAHTNVAVVQDKTNPHFKLNVKKMAAGTHYGGSAVQWPGGQGGAQRNPGDLGTFTSPGTVNLGDTDVDLKKDQWSESTRNTEVGRIKAAAPTKVSFQQDETAVASDAAGLAKLKAAGDLLAQVKHPRITIQLVGRASTEGTDAVNLDIARKRAEAVKAALGTSANANHDIIIVAKGEEGAGPGPEWRRVDVDIQNLPASWKNDYDVAGHEFGHMIGLHDEYQKPGGGQNDHFKLVEEAFGTKVAEATCSRKPGEDSSSIMDGGLDVRPMHYVTFWEALGALTAPTLNRSDWKIST